MTAFIIKHWRGHYSLARSFWGNFIGLFFLSILMIGGSAVLFVTAFPHSKEIIKFISPVILWGIIFPWQIVGVWRSAEIAKKIERQKKGIAIFSTLAQLVIFIYAFGIGVRALVLILALLGVETHYW